MSNKDLNIVGDFPNHFKNVAEKAAAMTQGRWEPDKDDFLAIAGNEAFIAGDIWHFISAIAFSNKAGKERVKGSIDRVNLFTHANGGYIGLSGNIEISATTANVLWSRAANTAIKEGAFYSELKKGFLLGKKKYELDQIRQLFSKNAVIVIYACRSAVDPLLLKEIANTFQVNVIGFFDFIVYCATFDDPPRKINYKIGIGECNSAAVSDYHVLSAQQASPIKPDPDPEK